MPHIELKTTADLAGRLDVPSLLRKLTERLSTFESVKPAAIKAYHVPIECWITGEGAPKGFAHCTVGILSGRPAELKLRMADGLVAVMREALAAEVQAGEASVTLELREMEAETYRK